jgi:predicted ATPase
MIHTWQVSNFKSIGKPVTLEMGALTILAGANSAGKSTLIQSILLVAQTLGSRNHDIPLLINGDLVTLGTAEDVWHAGDETRTMQIRFDLRDSESMRSLADTAAVKRITGGAAWVLHNGGEQLERRRVDLLWSHVESTLDGFLAGLRFQRVTDPREQRRPEALVRSDYFVVRDVSGSVSKEWDNYIYAQPWARHRKGVGVPLKECRIAAGHFLPRRVLVSFEGSDREQYLIMERYLQVLRGQEHITAEAQRDPIPPPVMAAVRDFLSRPGSQSNLYGSYFPDFVKFVRGLSRMQKIDLLEEMPRYFERGSGKGSKDKLPTFSVSEEPLPDSIRHAVDEIRSFFASQLYYVSAMRIGPRVLWEVSAASNASGIGIHGEGIARILYERWKQPVRFWDPLEGIERERPLSVALEHWLSYLNLIDAVQTEDLGKLGHQIRLKDETVTRPLDLTSVGLGVSQVLPVLVAGLVMEPASTLLVEQPEVHLHPSAQSRLGDFFLGLARSGRQVIVETHSEHLTNRVMRRIAESGLQSEDLLSLVRVHFAERHGGETVFRKVVPNRYGIIETWPEGFFDEGALEAQAILEASTNRRRLELLQRRSTSQVTEKKG